MVPRGTARGLPGGYRAQNESFRKFGKRCFLPPDGKSGVWRVSPSIIVRNWTPSGARLARKVFWDDNLAPISSDKI